MEVFSTPFGAVLVQLIVAAAIAVLVLIGLFKLARRICRPRPSAAVFAWIFAIVVPILAAFHTGAAYFGSAGWEPWLTYFVIPGIAFAVLEVSLLLGLALVGLVTSAALRRSIGRLLSGGADRALDGEGRRAGPPKASVRAGTRPTRWR